MTHLFFEDSDMILHQFVLVSLPRLGRRGESLVRTTKHQTVTRSHGAVSEDHGDHLEVVAGAQGLEPAEQGRLCINLATPSL